MKYLHTLISILIVTTSSVFCAAEDRETLRRAYHAMRDIRAPHRFRFDDGTRNNGKTLMDNYDDNANAKGYCALLYFQKNATFIRRIQEQQSDPLPWIEQLKNMIGVAQSASFLPLYVDELSLWLDMAIVLKDCTPILHVLQNLRPILDHGQVDPFYARMLLSDKISSFRENLGNPTVTPRKKNKKKKKNKISVASPFELDYLRVDTAWTRAKEYLDTVAPLHAFD